MESGREGGGSEAGMVRRGVFDMHISAGGCKGGGREGADVTVSSDPVGPCWALSLWATHTHSHAPTHTHTPIVCDGNINAVGLTPPN